MKMRLDEKETVIVGSKTWLSLLRAFWLDIRDSLYLVLFVFAPCVAIAAQLNLSSTPLFLTTAAKPNIMFLTDDSGSMDWNMVTSESDGVMTVSQCNKEFRYTYPALGATGSAPALNQYADTYIIPTEVALIASAYPSPYGGVWRARNSDYNKLHYNPDVRYSPWEGVTSTGALFSNVPYTAAPYDPYYPSRGTLNLASTISYQTQYCAKSGTSVITYTVNDSYPAHYYTWDSGTSDGVVDASDGHTLYEIRATGDVSCSTGATCPTTFARAATRTDCANPAACTRAEELQNFANWFSYYRKRNLAAKNAISKVVASSTDRMAHATLHNNGGAANISILQMNQSVSDGNKRALLTGVFKTIPNQGTPLRGKLDEVGRYFECVSGNIFGFGASSPGSANCPIQSAASGGECQQNFTVLMTDGFWNDSFTGIGNADGDGNTAYDTLAYRDSYSDTLADVAMYYYENDLATSLSNRVPVVAGTDNATHQHMVTYGVAFGVAGTLSAGPTSPTQSFTWPAVSANESTTVDDLRHASYNGRGEFLSAQSPESLATALNNTLVGIAGRTGSAAAVAVNSRSLSTSTRLYQARFLSGEWSGSLRALTIDNDGNVGVEVWSAAARLKSQNWDTGRVILAANTVSHGIPFRWTTTGGNALTATQISSLNDNPATTPVDDDGEGSARLNWLRGSTAHEGTGNNYRVRPDSFKLGDIVNSSPVFVGSPPNLPALETDPHSDFRATYVSRREIVYVGANDGMLHGFDAATGDEKIAFVPTAVFPNLSKLTYLSYSHNYFVDGSPTVGDAYGGFRNINSSCGSACWRTVLVGSLGAGGKGVFALDVTDPDGATVNGLAFSETNAANIVLWEIQATGANYSDDLGYVYGQPTIAKVRDGNNNYRYAAVFGNGYNSASERPVLYIVDVVDGSLIRKIVLSSGTGGGNGLGSPAVVDTDGDYIADYVYAGDLHGNMWKIKITDNNTSQWGSPITSGAPLFKAVASNVSQPITQRPEVSSHPAGLTGYMVYFGTGRYFVAGDNSASSSPVHTFYGIWDNGRNDQVPRDTLLQQFFSTATVASTTVRSVTNTTIQWCTANNISSCNCPSNGSGTCLGWRDDLLTTASDSLGEMSVSNPVLLGGTVPRIIFTTLIPQSDPCSYGGSSWLMELNPTNGGRLSEQVFDINGDGTITSADKIGGTTPVAGISPGIGIMPEPVILRDPANRQDLKTETGSTGAVQTIKNYVSGTTGGRQSWRQLK